MAGLDVQEWGTRELEGCNDSSLDARYVGKREKYHSRFLSQHWIFAWAVVLFGAEFSHLLWHMLDLQLLQEKVEDHLSVLRVHLGKYTVPPN